MAPALLRLLTTENTAEFAPIPIATTAMAVTLTPIRKIESAAINWMTAE